jgi:RimJ/RimL family protein N-acetyltransferase
VSLQALRLRTARLELRLASHEELVALGELAVAGIHPPEEMPFGVAWTDTVTVESFVAHHEEKLAAWQPDDWTLNLVTFLEGVPIGSQGVMAEDFARTRVVGTGSWLGRAYQGRGFGTEQRAAVLELAFGGLGARAALSGALEGNAASSRVSEKLGYRIVGTSTVSPRGVPMPHTDFRLEAADWPGYPVELEGLDPGDFGLY